VGLGGLSAIYEDFTSKSFVRQGVHARSTLARVNLGLCILRTTANPIPHPRAQLSSKKTDFPSSLEVRLESIIPSRSLPGKGRNRLRTKYELRLVRLTNLLFSLMTHWSILRKLLKAQFDMKGAMLQETLDLLFCQTLAPGPSHGHTVDEVIEQYSKWNTVAFASSIGLENRGWIISFWGTSENYRTARYDRLAAAGRKQIAQKPLGPVRASGQPCTTSREALKMLCAGYAPSAAPISSGPSTSKPSWKSKPLTALRVAGRSNRRETRRENSATTRFWSPRRSTE
jgi:PadR family transcriptional regulator PadR